MKILIFGHHPESYSGLGNVCYTIETLLLKNKIQFTHISTAGQHLPQKQFQDGSVIRHLDSVKSQLGNMTKDHDLILTVGDIWSHELVPLLVQAYKIPWVAYFGVEGISYPSFHCSLDQGKMAQLKMSRLLSYISSIWTYTQHSKDILQKMLPDENIDILKHCVDVKSIRNARPFGIREKLKLPDKKLALFIGDNNPRKGIDLFCAWLATNNDYIGYLHTQRFRDIGYDIEELKIINNLEGRLWYKEDLVQFLNSGYLSYSEIYGLYKDADLFLHPHNSEGFGLCVLEALVCKIPVLATDTCGPSTYLPKNCKLDVWQDRYLPMGGIGYLVQEPSLLDICSKIKKGKGKHDFQPVGYDIPDFEKNLLELLEKPYGSRKFFSA